LERRRFGFVGRKEAMRKRERSGGRRKRMVIVHVWVLLLALK
jgi:hypothetical protein